MKILFICLFLIINISSGLDQKYYVRSYTHIHDNVIVEEETEILFTNDTIFYNDSLLVVKNVRQQLLNNVIEYETQDYIFLYNFDRGFIKVNDMELNTVCIILDITKQAKSR